MPHCFVIIALVTPYPKTHYLAHFFFSLAMYYFTCFYHMFTNIFTILVGPARGHSGAVAIRGDDGTEPRCLVVRTYKHPNNQYSLLTTTYTLFQQQQPALLFNNSPHSGVHYNLPGTVTTPPPSYLPSSCIPTQQVSL